MKKLESIFFPVEKVSSMEIMKNSNMEFNSDNAFAIVAKWPESKREKTLNLCSDLYMLVENASVLKPLIPVLEEKFQHLNVFVSNDKDAQFSVRISPVVPSFSPRSEVIKPLITFNNSYDGKVLAQAIGGLVRYTVDAKGEVNVTYSIFLEGSSFKYTFKHSNENIYSMLGISAQIDTYLANFDNVLNQIELLKQVTIQKPTANKLEKLVRKLAKGTNFPVKEMEETVERITYESEIFDELPNLWSIYNSMNYIVLNSESKLTTKSRMDINEKIFANVCEFIPAQKKVKEPVLA